MTQTPPETPEQPGASRGEAQRDAVRSGRRSGGLPPAERRSTERRPAGRRSGGRRRRLTAPIALQLAAMIGIGALVYADAANWFATLTHSGEIAGYVEEVESMPAEGREAELALAREYNAFTPLGILRDPYSDPAPQGEFAADSAYRVYEELLRVSGSEVMGRVSYPRLGIGLPIYHGTGETVLSEGAGHLYGSSLPIGGPSTHSVLTAHSGLVHAALFTPLPKARIGDTFQVSVLGETAHYRVDQIETVLPEDTALLNTIQGEDHVTLITCTPIGVNSHRILVRGERIPAPEGSSEALAGTGAGFPWWAVIWMGGSAVTGYLLFARRRPQREETVGVGASTP